MKRLIIKLIIFILPIFVIAVGMEIYLRNLPNDYRFKREQIESKDTLIKTLILGGSHSFYGINPGFMEKTAFNLAYVSQSVYFDDLLFHKYIDSLPELEDVIMMVAYPTLSHRFNEGEEAWRKFNYFRYFDVDPPRNQFYQKYYLELFNIPFKESVRKVYRNIRGKSNITCTETGWCFKYKQQESQDLDKTGLEAAIRHENSSLDFTWSCGYLNDIIELCYRKKIALYLITFPTWEGYRKNLNKEKFDKMVCTCTELDEKYHHVKYFNFSEDPRFVMEDFYDGDHLNDQGAEKFTRIINALLD